MEATSLRRLLTIVFLGATALFAALGCLLYTAWVSSPGYGYVVEPYEAYLLYVQHYDWVNAPFLQSFRAASISAVCLVLCQLIPRAAWNWKLWLLGVVFFLALQVAVFNIAVNVIVGTNPFYYLYLAMTWFEPWIIATLAPVSYNLYSTGGVAFAALLASTLALFAARVGKGYPSAAIEGLLFVSASLFLFELTIAEYRGFWWNLQVTDFQFSIGISWLTNSMLYYAAGLCTVILALVRFASSRITKQLSQKSSGGS